MTAAKGYSVVEVIVALTLFITVVAISSSSTLAILNSNRTLVQSQGLFTNVEVALDDLARNLRSGTDYNGSGNSLSFVSQSGDVISYRLNQSLNMLEQSYEGGSYVSVFDNSVKVNNFKIIQEGSDQLQPRVTIILEVAVSDTAKNTQSVAQFQTTVVQRVLNITTDNE